MIRSLTREIEELKAKRISSLNNSPSKVFSEVAECDDDYDNETSFEGVHFAETLLGELGSSRSYGEQLIVENTAQTEDRVLDGDSGSSARGERMSSCKSPLIETKDGSSDGP